MKSAHLRAEHFWSKLKIFSENILFSILMILLRRLKLFKPSYPEWASGNKQISQVRAVHHPLTGHCSKNCKEGQAQRMTRAAKRSSSITDTVYRFILDSRIILNQPNKTQNNNKAKKTPTLRTHSASNRDCRSLRTESTCFVINIRAGVLLRDPTINNTFSYTSTHIAPKGH